MFDETCEKLTRRRFLTGGMTAVAALLVPAEITFPQAVSSGPFTQPPLETSRNGILQTQLRVVQADVPIPGSKQLERARCSTGPFLVQHCDFAPVNN